MTFREEGVTHHQTCISDSELMSLCFLLEPKLAASTEGTTLLLLKLQGPPLFFPLQSSSSAEAGGGGGGAGEVLLLSFTAAHGSSPDEVNFSRGSTTRAFLHTRKLVTVPRSSAETLGESRGAWKRCVRERCWWMQEEKGMCAYWAKGVAEEVGSVRVLGSLCCRSKSAWLDSRPESLWPSVGFKLRENTRAPSLKRL